MYNFSRLSKRRLLTCHEGLILLFTCIIDEVDCTIACGHRNQEEQDEAFRLNRSTKRWPFSTHNKCPSNGIDVYPHPINWKDTMRMAWFAGIVMTRARDLNLNIRWGGDWDRDTFTIDHQFIDAGHFEIIL